MKNLIERIKSLKGYSRFNSIPSRIFLDTNVLQYLQDFGEYIFDNYRESKEYFQCSRKSICKGERLFNEIEALHDIFININRTNFEFSLSPAVYHEVEKKGDTRFVSWFNDVWEHWQAVVSEYENREAFSPLSEKRYKKAVIDKSLSGSFSTDDNKIVLAAIRNDCNALLTVDKFAKDQNKKIYVFIKYEMMILTPVELIELIKPYQALWC